MTETDTFDLQVFNEAKAVLNTRFPDTIRFFFEDAEGYLREISEGIAAGDAAKVISSAHPLKSSSVTFGLVSLAEMSKKVEYGAREAQKEGRPLAEDVTALAQKLPQAVEKARSWVEMYL